MATGHNVCVFNLFTSNVRFLSRGFGDDPGQSRTETVPRLYRNRAVIVQFPQSPHGPYGGQAEMVR